MEKETTKDKCQRFIEYAIKRMGSDRALGARFRRADNPATEYQSWEYFSRFDVDLQNIRERKVFATVAAALARAKPKTDGNLSVGRAIALSFGNGKEDPQAKSRLRRLLACDTSEEACDILRPLLQLVASRGNAVKFEDLLRDLLYFSERKKERWAQDFFSTAPNTDDGNGGD
jgi:CRISPR system Cascade subunit CasB